MDRHTYEGSSSSGEGGAESICNLAAQKVSSRLTFRYLQIMSQSRVDIVEAEVKTETVDSTKAPEPYNEIMLTYARISRADDTQELGGKPASLT